jgi:myo-inositol-1(or 4)-monophosphatase
MKGDVPGDEQLAEIERAAVDLATLGGARIEAALGRLLTVRYKSSGEAGRTFRDPVSDVDHEVEALIRASVAERFPAHDVLGEESGERPRRGADFLWAVDPIDGTTNFVNGFPLFASSLGVLWQGRPLVGAVWCSTSHALRAGVYHARAGGPLRFEFDVIRAAHNPAVRRRLVGLGSPVASDLPWDMRRTGSAAVECAFVAAGLLDVARFDSPHVWDIAGGLALVAASGGVAFSQGPAGWEHLGGFGIGETEEIGDWQRPVLVGRPEAVETFRSCVA